MTYTHYFHTVIMRGIKYVGISENILRYLAYDVLMSSKRWPKKEANKIEKFFLPIFLCNVYKAEQGINAVMADDITQMVSDFMPEDKAFIAFVKEREDLIDEYLNKVYEVEEGIYEKVD